MDEQTQLHLESLRPSPWPLLAGLALAFLICQVAEIPGMDRLNPVLDGYYLAAAVAWAVGQRRPAAGRWLAIAVLLGLVVAAHVALPTLGALTLLAALPALAASLIGLPAAGGTALAASLLLLGLGRVPSGATTGSPLAPLIATWAVFGAVCAVYLPVHSEAQRMWGYYLRAQGLLRDARDRRQELHKAVEDLAFANHQLALLHEKVNSLRLIAEQAEKAKAAFLAKVSHEFRTPLNMIIGLSSLLTETPEVYGQQLPAKLLEHLEIVHRNCTHLSSLIDDVLDLSQVEAGRMALHREPVELGKVIEWASSVVRPLVEKKHLRLDVRVPAALPPVECDRTRISQVIINLLSNAARFTEKGSITVLASHEDGHVVISVADTGPGISAEDAAVIFQPFSQGVGGRGRDRGGSGLGLTISKQFVELHGGRMWLESQLGMGSTFFVRLPVSRPEEPPAASARWIAEGWTPQSPSLHLPPARLGQRLIICDETGELRRLSARYLEEMAIVAAPTLADAAREARQRPASAVLVNSLAPQDLWPLIEKASLDLPDTPIVGCSLNARITRALNAGARGQLLKPVTRERLAAAIAVIGAPARKLLVVDDGAEDREVMCSLLRAIGGDFEIATAASGEEALAALRRLTPDLMILDILMPGMDGWQVLELKAKDAHSRDVPVIIVSAQDSDTQPLRSRLVLATVSDGLPVSALMACVRELPALMQTPA